MIKIDKELFLPNFITNTQDIVALTSRNELEKEIHDLEDRIRRLKTGEMEADYFLRVGDLLFHYTEAQDRIAAGQKPIEAPSKKGRMPTNSVYAYFTALDEDSMAEQAASMPPTISASVSAAAPPTAASTAAYGESTAGGGAVTVQGKKRAADIDNDIGFKRDKALECYMSALNSNHHTSLCGSIQLCNCERCYISRLRKLLSLFILLS